MLSKLFGFSAEHSFLKWSKASDVGCKNIQALKTVPLPTPKQVRIHMNQNKEAPCVPVVKKGDEVKIGQIIGTHDQYPNIYIHASVSGKVTKIDDVLLENGIRAQEVVIEADGLQSIDPNIQPPLIHHEQDLIEVLEQSGINELNTFNFLSTIERGDYRFDTLLINATSWEPFVATPTREILENPDDVLNGIAMLMKHLNIAKAVIGIEESQSKSIECLQNTLASKGEKYANISLKLLTSSCSSESKRLLIQACAKGTLEKNILVLNVLTVGALSRYLETGLPVITMSLTVNGSAVREPKNVIVPIGTPIEDVINFCVGYKNKPKKILQGGLMTGDAVVNDDATISKQTTALFAFGEKEAEFEEEAACIRCARCVEICPMQLMPVSIDEAVRFNHLDELENLNLSACTECGSCSFICPANRHLVQTIHLGKSLLKNTNSVQNKEKGASLDE